MSGKSKSGRRRRSKRNKRILTVIGIVTVAAVLLSLFYVFGRGSFSTPSGNPSPSPTPMATPLTSPSGEYSANGTRVLFATSMGDIIVQLRDDKPITTANFINLTNDGYYVNTLFHRVLANFIIEGGDRTGTGYGDDSMPTIPDEIGNNNRNERGTIAMANAGQPNSSNTQFFFNLIDNGPSTIPNGKSFDSTYTVFGKVIQGMNVLDSISGVAVTADPYTGESSRPLKNVVLYNAIVL
jgi:peptidylprolyl isomerase